MTSPITAFLTIFTFAVVINSCRNDAFKKTDPSGIPEKTEISEQVSYKFTKPAPNQTFRIGDILDVSLAKTDTLPIDSIRLFLGDQSTPLSPEDSINTSISSSGLNPGNARLRLNVYMKEGKIRVISVPVVFLSDVRPKEYHYRIIKEYPHDRSSFTQGFEYKDGFFYEGTGQYGESSLRKTVYHSGEVVKFKKLPQDVFGEGITLLNGKIFQVTYRNKVGFVYDMDSFEQLRRIYYQNQEGWGLTNDGQNIIMSDGTHVLYFMDPEYFGVDRKIEVFDYTQAVDSLNELEYINNLIYANRYLSDQIVMIDPQTGKVVGRVNLAGLLRDEEKEARTDVLNGIAWDSENKRLFVTGKYWPKIYHIELIGK